MEALANNFETFTKGRWQWRLNPWSQTEEAKWESYSYEHNYLIEKAYYEKKDETDLGDYIISIKHMIQKKKGYVTKQRPIKRINWKDCVHEIDRSARHFETEVPRTINRIFGSLSDFVSFFSRRNQDILDLTIQFKEFEQSNNLNILNDKIAKEVVKCLQEVLPKPNLEQLEDPSLSKFKKKVLLDMNNEITNLISLFQTEFLSIEEFYGNILKAYTMNTDLYPILNNCLRNETWVEVDKLLPYAFCLCKAFFHLRLKKDSAPDSETPSSIFLYRGTAFDEVALSFYDMEKVQNFSWNSVTSTSKDRQIAEGFMYRNSDLANKKYPVLFVIEIPLITEFEPEYLKWIDIHQYSAIPKEDEVVLAPGSVFELIEVSTDQDEKTTIKIKLRNEITSLAHGGMMMQGALQSQMMTEKEAKIVCVEGKELSQALVILFGNKLIEELEFCLCTFDRKLLNQMFQTIQTLQKLKMLKFIACLYENNGEPMVEGPKEGERCEVTKIEVIEANDFFQVICNEKRGQEYWFSLRELDLDFKNRLSLTDEELNCAISQGLSYLRKLTSLSINFQMQEEITDDGVNSLTQTLRSLIQLTYLNINSFNCDQITDNGVIFLAQILSSLNRLTYLDLNFGLCGQITDEGINGFAEGLSSLTQLTHLNLNFESSSEITDLGVNSLAQGLNSLTQLRHINLNFRRCRKTIDNGINIFAQRLDSLNQLTHLNLNFGGSDKITSNEVNSFAKRINSLTKLTHLEIDFQWCMQITDDGVNIFAQGINSLTQLIHLNLNFSFCNKITNKGVNSLAKSLNSLTQLTYLNLYFVECNLITNEGVSILMSQGLKDLTRLTSLILDFDLCKHITSQDLSSLSCEWLKYHTSLSLIVKDKRIRNVETPPQYHYATDRVKLARDSFHQEKETFYEEISSLEIMQTVSGSLEQPEKLLTQYLVGENEDMIDDNATGLTLKISEKIPEILQLNSLTLNFRNFKNIITDEFLHKLSSQVLLNLPQLKSLSLNFIDCSEITAKGVGDLASYGLKSLANLSSLRLGFHNCRIKDKEIFDLASEGLKHLSQLKSLALDFSRNLVTDEGLKSLALHGLRHISQLKSLALNFSDQVTEEGLMSLAWYGLRYLSQLEALALWLSPEITDKGVDDFFSQGLKYLTQLKFLGLQISDTEITNKGVNNLILQVVKSLPQFLFFDLDFEDSLKFSDSTVHNIIKVLHYFGFTKKIESETLLDWIL